MKAFLKLSKLWEAIEQTPTQSTSSESATDNQPTPVDPILDDNAKSEIELAVSSGMLNKIAEDATAKQAWDGIIAAGIAAARAAVPNLSKALSNISLQPQEKIAAYITRAVDIQRQLIEAGHPVSDSELTRHILFGLPDDYNTAIQLINHQQALPIAEVQAQLQVTYELLHRNRKTPIGDQPAKALNVRANAKKVCYYCNKRGHIESECRAKSRNTRHGSDGRMACTWCGKTGHTEDNCYSKRKGQPKSSSFAPIATMAF